MAVSGASLLWLAVFGFTRVPLWRRIGRAGMAMTGNQAHGAAALGWMVSRSGRRREAFCRWVISGAVAGLGCHHSGVASCCLPA